ncbi:MAG: Clp protease, partial [Eubacteriales bacterium]
MQNTEETKEKNKEEPKPNKSNDPIKEYGSASIPQAENEPVYIINIIGEIEGHMMLPPQSKA